MSLYDKKMPSLKDKILGVAKVSEPVKVEKLKKKPKKAKVVLGKIKKKK